ncbi:MAG: nucleoside monophosphate kinase [Patescibacteria group bacterium]
MNIGLVGHPAVGKDIVANFIVKNYGYSHVSTSDLIREYITEHNLGIATREHMREVANNLRAKHGGGYLVELGLEKVNDKAIISGMRAVEEAAAFKKTGGVLLAVTAPLELRYTWTRGRARATDNITFEVFKEHEEVEANSKDAGKQNVYAVMALADYTISNDGTLEELYGKIEGIMKKLNITHEQSL